MIKNPAEAEDLTQQASCSSFERSARSEVSPVFQLGYTECREHCFDAYTRHKPPIPVEDFGGYSSNREGH